MRVMLTGGTGFIGYHATLVLLEAGHDVVLLVRNADKMRKLYGERIEHFVVGDITEAHAVNKALDGCNAVISIAAMVSTDAKDAELVYNTNVEATKRVIGGAVERGLERIIHVSSVTALYRPEADILTEKSPPGNATTPYGRSKVACERYVRALQAKGESIHITYPASVIGPDSPGVTEAHDGIRIYLNNWVPQMPSGNQFVDVRDVARAHRLLLERDLPPGGFILGGHFITWQDQIALINELTGRDIQSIPLYGGFVRSLGWAADRINDWLSIDLAISYEGTVYATDWKRMDNSKTERDLDFSFRDLRTSFADTIRWLYKAGHIDAEQAGELSA